MDTPLDEIELSGTVENIVYVNEQNDYTVLELETDKHERITAVGTVPMAAEGEILTVLGNFTYHEEYGRQFVIRSFEKRLPSEADGILKYLSSRTVKGVGEVTAKKIVDRFGADTFDVIENHPEWLTDVSGISPKKAATISESFREQSGIRGVMMFCKDHLGTGEITRVWRRFGAGAVGIIRDNPYILCDAVEGISFTAADAIAATLGVAPNDPHRMESGIRYVLEYNANVNGHTCLPREKLRDAVSSLLKIPSNEADGAIEEGVLSNKFETLTVAGNEQVMTHEIAEAEAFITKRVERMQVGDTRYAHRDILAMIERTEALFGMNYAPAQREAIYRAMCVGMMVITGGPGTGKTTIIKALLSIFSEIGLKCVLCAPTGRAAKRMSEATSEPAKTIHRLLEMERVEGDEARFRRDEGNPIEEDVVIVDEASMLDLKLIYALMRAMRRSARLILIGDIDQLPSVGAGNVLSDLIESGAVCTVRLEEIFRQSEQSLIVTNAHKINEGCDPVLTRTDGDFFFVARNNEREISATVADLVLNRLPRAYGREVKEGIQVITPSRKGAAGVETLNAVLQNALNPERRGKPEKSAHGTLFRVGDRVMQNRNDYEIGWEKDGIEGVGIFNGDIGVVEEIDNVDRFLKINFDDRVATYNFDLLDELELAYAITVHKSQGSEYPVVIIPIYSCPPMLLSRNLLYTAVTRAKRMVILVGRRDLITRMVQNRREVLRYTSLLPRLCALPKQS